MLYVLFLYVLNDTPVSFLPLLSICESCWLFRYSSNLLVPALQLVTLMRSTSNNVGLYFPHYRHEWSVFQSVGVQAIDWQRQLGPLYPSLFFFFLSFLLFTFLIKECSDQKLILQKLTKAPKNLGVYTFPDPVCHFRAL